MTGACLLSSVFRDIPGTPFCSPQCGKVVMPDSAIRHCGSVSPPYANGALSTCGVVRSNGVSPDPNQDGEAAPAHECAQQPGNDLAHLIHPEPWLDEKSRCMWGVRRIHGFESLAEFEFGVIVARHLTLTRLPLLSGI